MPDRGRNPACRTTVTAYGSTDRAEQIEEGSGLTRLIEATGAPETSLTFRIKPFLDPDASRSLKASRRSGVPDIPWWPSTLSANELQRALGAPLHLARRAPYVRERELRGERESQLLVRLAEGEGFDTALDLLGPDWVELDDLPEYGLDNDDAVEVLGRGCRALHARLTVRQVDSVLAVALHVAGDGTWLVLTTVHARPSSDFRETARQERLERECARDAG